MERFTLKPSLPPPQQKITLLQWLKINIFLTPRNILWSILILLLLSYAAIHLWQWVIWDANFLGTTKEDCNSSGACWVFIKVHIHQFLYGLYPSSEYWRINLSFIILIAICLSFALFGINKKWWLLVIFVYPLIAFALFYGGIFGLQEVETNKWGGLFLTFLLTISSIGIGLPLGVLLALGRQSKMPAIESLCIVFIEVIRGVPLITILFMASVMLPLFLPTEMHIDKLLRAIIGISIFAAAYLAEAIRGGLQTISKGQYEAAQALGLGYWHKQIFIILPQAFTISIPPIVGSFISLLKDTTLVTIIGMSDFLTMGYISSNDPKWLGYSIEVYVFCAAIYWILCFSLSYYSHRLEDKLAEKQH
jgi:general L-amino acid transport system permease protein